MARAKASNFVWFTATTRWGRVRIREPLGTYRRATARGRDDKLAATVDSIPDLLGEEADEPTELFPELKQEPSSKTMDADFICGCVPFPVTTS